MTLEWPILAINTGNVGGILRGGVGLVVVSVWYHSPLSIAGVWLRLLIKENSYPNYLKLSLIMNELFSKNM